MAGSQPAPRFDAELDEQPPRHPYRGFVVRAALGLGLLTFLVWRFGGSVIFSTIARERPAYFVAAIALYLVSQLVSTLRWRVLAYSVSIRAPFRQFLAYYFIGMFTNLFVPGLLGGDAARALYLGRKHDRLTAAAASVVADRVVGLIALFWLAGAAAAIAIARNTPVSATVTEPVTLMGLAALAGFLAAPFIARAERWVPSRLAPYAELVTLYTNRPSTLIPALALSVLLQLIVVLCQYLLALGLGLAIPFFLFILCVPIANVLASIPVTMNGLGLREGTYAVLFGMVGLGHANAVALGLLLFATTMLGGLIGIFPFLTTDSPVRRGAKIAEISP